MLDISEKSYRNRTFPLLYAQKDFTKRSYIFIKDDEFDTYHFDYGTVVELMKLNLINTHKKIFISNAPLLKHNNL